MFAIVLTKQKKDRPIQEHAFCFAASLVASHLPLDVKEVDTECPYGSAGVCLTNTTIEDCPSGSRCYSFKLRSAEGNCCYLFRTTPGLAEDVMARQGNVHFLYVCYVITIHECLVSVCNNINL